MQACGEVQKCNGAEAGEAGRRDGGGARLAELQRGCRGIRTGRRRGGEAERCTRAEMRKRNGGEAVRRWGGEAVRLYRSHQVLMYIVHIKCVLET